MVAQKLWAELFYPKDTAGSAAPWLAQNMLLLHHVVSVSAEGEADVRIMCLQRLRDMPTLAEYLQGMGFER